MCKCGTWNIFSLDGHALWPETGEKFSTCYIWRGRRRKELDELSRQRWEGPWAGVLILEMSATCSWEEKVIPFSVQVWPVGIEDCIALPVEGEEWDMDHQ